MHNRLKLNYLFVPRRPVTAAAERQRSRRGRLAGRSLSVRRSACRSWPQPEALTSAAWLTAVFLVDVAVLVLAVTCAMHGLVSPLQDWSSVPEAALVAGSIPAIDDRRCFGRDVVGVHEYQGRLVALIAVDARRTHRWAGMATMRCGRPGYR